MVTAAPPIVPQPGFQVDALSTEADIAIIGGAAGAGKSFVLLMESTRYTGIDDFGGVIFRRTSPQIRNKGGLLDASRKVYVRLTGSRLRENELEWKFRGGQTIKFSHLQHDKDVHDHQGAEYPFIGFDELCHFSEYQFFYMLSRNRSTCGVKPYVRATCNPDADSWVAGFIEWFIDQETGFPIPERCGKLRYFIRLGGFLVWGDTKEEVYEQIKEHADFMEAMEQAAAAGVQWESLIKSMTFIPGSIYNNRKLLQENPEYLGNLLALDENEQNQLLKGNWKISMDGLALCEYQAVQNLFSNYNTPSNNRYITCDVARFGRDFTVMFVWRGWEVVKIVIMYKSEKHEVQAEIEKERQAWGVIRSNVLVDQDGVGGGVVKDGGYRGFSGGAAALIDLSTAIKEQYFNQKTQMCYRTAEENINTGEIRISVTSENVLVIDGSKRMFTTKIKAGGKVQDVRDLIKADLRAWKKKPRDEVGKLQMNNKDEQKVLLNGRSPDFGDNIFMRKWFDIAIGRRGIRQQ